MGSVGVVPLPTSLNCWALAWVQAYWRTLAASACTHLLLLPLTSAITPVLMSVNLKRCAPVPLSVHCCSGAPSAPEAFSTSTARPFEASNSLYRPVLGWVTSNCWAVLPLVQAASVSLVPLAVPAPVTHCPVATLCTE